MNACKPTAFNFHLINKVQITKPWDHSSSTDEYATRWCVSISSVSGMEIGRTATQAETWAPSTNLQHKGSKAVHPGFNRRNSQTRSASSVKENRALKLASEQRKCLQRLHRFPSRKKALVIPTLDEDWVTAAPIKSAALTCKINPSTK